MKHVLIAEDDEHIRQGLVDALDSENYQVTAVDNGQKAVDQLQTLKPDLIILDIMMPEMNGYDCCKSIRKENDHTPIIMLTAKGEEIDKVLGFELGADDYVTKPFGVRELLARVAAHIRRSEKPKAEASSLPEHFKFGSADVNSLKYEAVHKKKSYSLSQRELDIIQCFLNHKDEVLTRDALLNHAWGIDYLGTTRTLDQHIAQLRKKIEVTPNNPKHIITVHGVGYKFTA